MSMQTGARGTTESVIHDLGYRHYAGARLGRAYAVRSLFLYSLRAAFGIGRGAKAKILPFMLAAIVLVPAVVSVALVASIGLSEVEFIPYDGYPYYLQVALAAFVATQAPELLSRDLRGRVLPLYFSRPLRRDDYALAKLGAMVSALALLLAMPLLLLYLGAVLTADDTRRGIWDETLELLPALANVAVHAVVLGTFGLAIASLASRRPYATGSVIAVYLLSTAVSGVFIGVSQSPGAQALAHLLTPFEMLEGFKIWVLRGESTGGLELAGTGPWFVLATVAFVAAGVLALLARYRKVET